MTPAIMAIPQSLTPWAATPPPAPTPQPAPQPQEDFKWSHALQVPAYTYAGASGALSGLVAFADRFPPGGVTINPGHGTGIIRNPDWTRHFTDGSVFQHAQPILAGVSALICLTRGTLELSEGMKTGNVRQQWAGALDLGIAAASVLQIASPGVGAAATLGLAVARGVMEVHG